MSLSKDSLLLFQELLIQVRVSPFQPDADAVWKRIINAKNELSELLVPIPISQNENVSE